MVELIAFLIEHFQDFDSCPSGGDLGHVLEEVGFDEADIHKLLMLIDVLNEASQWEVAEQSGTDRKSTRLNSSHRL